MPQDKAHRRANPRQRFKEQRHVKHEHRIRITVKVKEKVKDAHGLIVTKLKEVTRFAEKIFPTFYEPIRRLRALRNRVTTASLSDKQLWLLKAAGMQWQALRAMGLNPEDSSNWEKATLKAGAFSYKYRGNYLPHVNLDMLRASGFHIGRNYVKKVKKVKKPTNKPDLVQPSTTGGLQKTTTKANGPVTNNHNDMNTFKRIGVSIAQAFTFLRSNHKDWFNDTDTTDWQRILTSAIVLILHLVAAGLVYKLMYIIGGRNELGEWRVDHNWNFWFWPSLGIGLLFVWSAARYFGFKLRKNK